MLKTLTNIAAMRRLATLAALFGAALGANAATIANTFGPGDSFSSTSGLAIGKNPPSLGNSPVNNLGGNFTVNGSDYTFTGAEAALQLCRGRQYRDSRNQKRRLRIARSAARNFYGYEHSLDRSGRYCVIQCQCAPDSFRRDDVLVDERRRR